MSRATGLLFPSLWEEPFGLVLAEAQAAGTPAITFDTGAAREIILPGETGYILPVNDLAGAAAAVTQLEKIERAACRRNIAAKFTIEKMLEEYEDYYYEKLGRI
jgi:glycosyltransferase involved in cell wall biosynthesis